VTLAKGARLGFAILGLVAVLVTMIALEFSLLLYRAPVIWVLAPALTLAFLLYASFRPRALSADLILFAIGIALLLTYEMINAAALLEWWQVVIEGLFLACTWVVLSLGASALLIRLGRTRTSERHT
jgi:hypothetical protein